MTTTEYDAQAVYDSLTAEQRAQLWRGGKIPDGTGLRCDECPQPAVYSVENGINLRLACSNAVHIAWASSCGSACPVSEITSENGYPVDESTLPELPGCGCDVYAEIDGRFTVYHKEPCPRSPEYYDEPVVPIKAMLLMYLIQRCGGEVGPEIAVASGSETIAEAVALFSKHAAEWLRRIAERDKPQPFQPGDSPF